MSLLGCPLPEPPDWRVDWQRLDEQLDWIREMRGCPQDREFHAEGDVWIHVRMVCEALAGLAEWRALASGDRDLLFTAALLHDVAKPECTRTENGRIHSRGHSQRGAIHARRIPWELGAPIAASEEVCDVVLFHQWPFHPIQRAEPVRLVLRISQTVRCGLLAMLAKADGLGRVSVDQAELLLRIDLFQELCREQGCLHQPWPFSDSLSRFQYFRAAGRDPHYTAHDESRCEVLLMSGLPGAGKDTWISRHAGHLPQISLDAIREELGAAPTGNQGAVVQLAKDQARALLRRREPFVWNATNLSAELRAPLIDLFTDYGARTRIVYVEAAAGQFYAQNAGRERVVPRPALDRLMDRWEVPGPTEAARVECWPGDSVWIRT